jgi:SAM-dependent methyltransferase
MTAEKFFKERYEAGDTPWDIGAPDSNLIQVVTSRPIKACKAMDIGCGTGDNAIWLSQRKFHVVGIDVSEVAIEKAKEKALKANAKCTFVVGNFLKRRSEGTSFGFAFDRGCWHTMNSDRERKRFAATVNAHLQKDGLWLSLIGNADEQRHAPGPPQRTARQIVNSVEPYFEILSLISGCFGSSGSGAPRAWVCLMRKRRVT